MQLIERSLRGMCHRIARVRGGPRLVERVRRHYAKHYAGGSDSLIVLDDFDGDLKFRVDRASYMGSLIYWRGYHSRPQLMCLDRFLQPHMVFADVGANHGEFTTFAAKRLGQGKVLAFEPLEENYRWLVENVQLNRFPNVLTYQLGLSDRPGEVDFFTSNDTRLFGSSHEGLATMFPGGDRTAYAGRAQVDVFDDVFRETGLRRLDGMKIDVEGAELSVLRGARQSIQRHQPFILVEINAETYQAAGYCKKDLCEFLQGLDYQVFNIGRHGDWVPINADQLFDLCNVLWLPRTFS